MAKSPLMFTVAEFADDLRVTPQHIYKLISRGEIRAIRLGKTVRIPCQERNRLLADPTAPVHARKAP